MHKIGANVFLFIGGFLLAGLAALFAACGGVLEPEADKQAASAFILTCLTDRPVSLYDFEKSSSAIGT
jgi:hypothetical protein